MAQHDYVIANASGASVRADINNMALAISSNNSGSSEPSTTYAYLWWLDSSANVLKLRNSANNAWITMPFSITASNTVDINGGAIDGTNIGASAAGTGAFTTLTATTFTSTGIDDNADATAITISSAEKVTFAKDIEIQGDSVSGSEGGHITLRAASGGSKEFGIDVDSSNNLRFLTEDDGTGNNGAAHVYLTNTGNVGIGTSSPANILHVHQSDASSNAYVHITQQDGGSAGTDGLSIGIEDGGVNAVIRNRENGYLRMYTNNAERMRIDSTGRVGINRTPAITNSKLEVGGADNTPLINVEASGTTGGMGVGNSALKFYHGTAEAAAFKIGSGSNEVMSIGGVTPRADIALTQQGHGENWATGAHTTNGYLYMITSAHAGVYMIPGQSTWTSNSDERIKENITSLGTILPEIANIRCVKFNLKGDSETRVGFIAQDWESKTFSEVLNENEGFVVEADGSVKAAADSDSTDKVKGIAYTETIPVLLKAIQEQQTIIEDLKTRIETLEG